MTLTVPCLLGLESLVAEEMRRLGLEGVRAENGAVHCTGTLGDIARLNIGLRCGGSWGPAPPPPLTPSLRGRPSCPGRTISPGTGSSR